MQSTPCKTAICAAYHLISPTGYEIGWSLADKDVLSSFFFIIASFKSRNEVNVQRDSQTPRKQMEYQSSDKDIIEYWINIMKATETEYDDWKGESRQRKKNN